MDKKDSDGNTPLHLAAKKGDKDSIKILLMLGARTEERNKKGETPLHLAALSGSEEAVGSLLEAGADVWAETEDERTVWHVAASAGHSAVLRLLTGKNSEESLRENTKPKVEEVEVLNVSEGRSGNRKVVEEGENTLEGAVKTELPGSGETLKLTDELTREPKKVGEPRETNDLRKKQSWENIYRKAEIDNETDSENEEVIKVQHKNVHTLIFHKIPPIFIQESEDEELDQKFEQNIAFVLNMMSSTPMDIHFRDELNFSFLHIAARCRAVNAVRKLIKLKADVDAEGIDGITPLIMATAGGSMKIFQLLIKAGANYNKTDDKRRSLLHFAANWKQEALVKRLLSLGLDPNAKTVVGHTPLHLAAMRKGNGNICKLLIKHGANPTEMDIVGLTPYFFAMRLNDTEMVHILSSNNL